MQLTPPSITEPLLPDEFVYEPDPWRTEELTRYGPGGYHPVVIGNIFRSPTRTVSYRILNKLGHGAFATVWLAETSGSSPKYVALKVSTSDGESKSEADHLQSVSSPYIVPVFDFFSIEGPNGTHFILVTELLLPLSDFLTIPHNWETRKRVIWELVKAMEDLHASGLAHGGNTGVTLSQQIHSLSIFDLLVETSDPVMTAILLDEMTKNTASLPPYVIERCDMKNLYKKEAEHEPRAKLLDFGSVRKHDHDGRDLMYERLSRVPEIEHASKEVGHVLNPPLQQALDIWALGAMIYRIVTGHELFRWENDLYLPDNSVSLADKKAHEDKWWKTRKDVLRKHCPNDADCDTLVSLFERIFVLDPSERPSAATIAQDAWFHAVSTVVV